MEETFEREIIAERKRRLLCFAYQRCSMPDDPASPDYGYSAEAAKAAEDTLRRVAALLGIYTPDDEHTITCARGEALLEVDAHAGEDGLTSVVRDRLKEARRTIEHYASEEDGQRLVDDREARRLADDHRLPLVEVDAALYGETVAVARSVLRWIDEEEGRLVRQFGLLEGRKRYRPVSMLRNWSRRHGAGRRRADSRSGSPG